MAKTEFRAALIAEIARQKAEFRTFPDKGRTTQKDKTEAARLLLNWENGSGSDDAYEVWNQTILDAVAVLIAR